MDRRRLRGYIAASLGAFSVWWAAPLVKMASVDPLTAAWWRFSIGSLGAVLAHRLLCTECPVPLNRLAVAAGLLLALHMVLWFAALAASPVLPATALVCTYPAFAAAIEALRGEIPWWKGAGIILALLSATALAWSGVNPVAALLSLASSLAAAMYFLVLRAGRLRGMPATGLAISVYATAFAVTSAASLAAGLNPLDVRPEAIPYLVALGLVPMAVGHTLLNYSLAYLPASIVTSLVLTEPPGAALIAYLALGETPAPPVTLYSSLALLATLVALLPGSATRH